MLSNDRRGKFDSDSLPFFSFSNSSRCPFPFHFFALSFFASTVRGKTRIVGKLDTIEPILSEIASRAL